MLSSPWLVLPMHLFEVVRMLATRREALEESLFVDLSALCTTSSQPNRLRLIHATRRTPARWVALYANGTEKGVDIPRGEVEDALALLCEATGLDQEALEERVLTTEQARRRALEETSHGSDPL